MDEIQHAIEKARGMGYYIHPLKTSDGYYIARQADVDSALPHRGAVDVPCITVTAAEIIKNGAEHAIASALAELNAALA